MSTIEDCAGYSLFDRLLMLAERARADAKEDNIRVVVEEFLNVPKYTDRVYVKRRTSDPDGASEALHEEGIFSKRKWKWIQKRMQSVGGVDVGGVFEHSLVPMSKVELTVVDDPCEVAAIDAMSLNLIARNAFERVGTNDGADANSDDEPDSDAESDAN